MTGAGAMQILGLVAGALGLFAAGLGAALSWRRARACARENASLRAEISRLRAAAAEKDKAEAASRAKSRFLATVSHEIRTPLNGVLGLAHLLSMTPLAAEQASYVESIGDCARALAALIDDILDFSKIEAGKLELRAESFALAPLVEGVVELLAPRAQGKALEIASFVAPGAPARVTSDPARLRQVLINLVGNAVNFTRSGGVGLRVRPTGDGALRFEVMDTGPGVAPATQEAIFEEFEQGDASAARPHGGTGLGLAISRRLVRMMGGELALAESSPQGSIFAFTLPTLLEEDGRAPARPLAGRRALIIAATRFEAPFLARYLEAAGAQAEIARDEAEGRARLAEKSARPFDAAIVDCALGQAATAGLAAAARAAGVSQLFLLFSPFERRAFGEAALQSFDGWLVKPVRAASLIDRLSLAAPKPVVKAAPAPVLAGLRVLLAEDNEINALIAMRQLEALGARPIRAENGAAAVEIAGAAIARAQAGFDVIMMDLFMPGLDGLEATRRIRRAEALAGAAPTPIIAVTASALEEDRRAARDAGVDQIFTKPLDFTLLAQMIEASGERPPAPRQSAGAA